MAKIWKIYGNCIITCYVAQKSPGLLAFKEFDLEGFV